VYVRLLLDAPASSASGGGAGIVERLPAPRDFFAAVHHRLLCLGDASLLAGGGGGAPARQREAEAEADRELCLRAMAAVYHVHAGVIGPVEGLPHLLALLDATPSRSLRWVWWV
jgi:DnaJ family protein C protein 13